MEGMSTSDENQGPLTNTLTWAFTSIAIVFVAMRLVSRLKIKPNAGWDDLAIVIALVGAIQNSIYLR